MGEHEDRRRRLSAPRIRLAVVLLLFLGLGTIYMLVTPPFESPDEASHFLYIHNLANTGQLPVIEGRDTMFESFSVQRHHPPLYYLIGAGLVGGLDRSDVGLLLQGNPFAAVGVVSPINVNAWLHPLAQAGSNALVAVRLLRIFGVLLGMGTVWLAYRAGRALGGTESVGLVSSVFVAMLPGFIFISASVTNDTLITFLSSAALVLLLESWQARQFKVWRGLLLGVIAGGAALTKINGLMILPIIALWALLALVSRRFTLRQLLGPLLLAGLVTIALSGWWYVRNIQLYGDPLAMQATLRIWGRGAATAAWDEASGVWDSFWMVLGQFNVRGPDWFYRLYAPALTVVGLSLTIWASRRHRADRWMTIFLTGAALITVIALIAATSQLNVSQGRILFPALVAFGPLLVVGLRRMTSPAVTVFALGPLILAAITAPLLVVTAYPGAHLTDQLSERASVIGADAAGLILEGAEWSSAPLHTGDALDMSVYLHGANPDNPFLTLRAVHPVTQEVLGSVNVYPGMQPTNAQVDGLIDAALRLPISGHVNQPTQVQLLFGWEVPGATATDPSTRLIMELGGIATDTVRLNGPVLLPDAALTDTTKIHSGAQFGEIARLDGLTLDGTDDGLTTTLFWTPISQPSADYTLTLGIMSAEGEVLVQADGPVAGYPTSAWVTGIPFSETRTLALPRPLEAGDSLFLGWYDPRDGSRLAVNAREARDNLLWIPLADQSSLLGL
ncbi:MAG: glycosyltransferase family 39 protein [Anaerolineae bacterium]